jgi:hypothetical protein
MSEVQRKGGPIADVLDGVEAEPACVTEPRAQGPWGN